MSGFTCGGYVWVQTVQYIQPQHAAQLSQAELVVIDEAAAIPLPVVKTLLGPYLVFLCSTVNGYEGTGRSLSLKLIEQLRAEVRRPCRTSFVHGCMYVCACINQVSQSEPQLLCKYQLANHDIYTDRFRAFAIPGGDCVYPWDCCICAT